MSEMRVTTYEMPAAPMYPENPLPKFPAPSQENTPLKFDADIPKVEQKLFGYGGDSGPLPHRMQDHYSRERRTRAFPVVVLENEILRATFLLEMGGRLWSLYHKPQQRELLYVNPVFQPANFAVRDAWICGGVEWNIGVRGHTPYTCSPLFAARVNGADDQPVFRMYEWDRARGTPYQMDFSLPDGSPWLLMRARIVNPHATETPMYWWSNMAVPERADVRVVVPAQRAFNCETAHEVRFIPIPIWKDRERTYPTRRASAGDDFYYLEDGQRPWITALDQEGRGLVQASTFRLRGRKLFIFGMGPGSRRWQEFLSVPNWPYFEIQAGLARTQSQCLPMPPRSEWSWLEAYGLMEADPVAVHGKDWSAARRTVESELNRTLPQAWLETENTRGDLIARRSPVEIIQKGSGWGALERRRRAAAHEQPLYAKELVFDDASLGPDQSPWLALLERGELPYRGPDELPGAWIIQPEWHRLLETAVGAKRGDHWLAWLHLGVMDYGAGDSANARKSWETSLARLPSAWALRNLAVLAKHEKRLHAAADLWREACRMAPQLIPLVIETLQILNEAGRSHEVMTLLAELPAPVQNFGRAKALIAQAALEVGDLDKAERILKSKIEVANIGEGEVVLTDLWFRLHEQRLAAAENKPIDDALRQRVQREFPPPPHLDFRMTTPTAS